MNYFFKVEIPKETSKSLPYEEKLKVSYGVIRGVRIWILPGHAGLAGLQLFFHESQLYPFNRGSFYLGDNISIKFNDNYALHIEPYQLKAVGYNEDIRYNHAFLVSLNILREGLEEMGETGGYDRYIGEMGE